MCLYVRRIIHDCIGREIYYIALRTHMFVCHDIRIPIIYIIYRKVVIIIIYLPVIVDLPYTAVNIQWSWCDRVPSGYVRLFGFLCQNVFIQHNIGVREDMMGGRVAERTDR